MHLASRSDWQPLRAMPPGSWLLALALSACTFEPGSGAGAGAGADAAHPVDALGADLDASPAPTPRDVVHVPENAWLGSDRAVTWNDDVTIDTSTLQISGPGVAGMADLTFVTSSQQPSGPDLALLYLGDWTVASGVIVRVVGDLPLVVISSGDIELQGILDAGARGQAPGVGGADPGAGQGAGQPGSHAGSSSDSGGGGAGHATAGARGGRGCVTDGASCTPGADVPEGGTGGNDYGEPAVPVLAGGSGGGTGGTGGDLPCPPGAGGAGGGAIQLYALGTITIAASGGIHAGGGGGGPGGDVGNCNATAGGGGGSGGAIYLQAARLELAGILAANGGGGGAGGAGLDGAPPGSDGLLSNQPAPGGSLDPDGVVEDNGSSPGGAGAAGILSPGQGGDELGEPNAGGGGGAAGYVVLHCDELAGAGITSPPASLIPGCGPP